MRKKALSGLKIGLVFLIAGGSGIIQAGSQHYRWVNDRGEPVYSDRPPPKGVEYEIINSTSGFKREVAAEQGAVPLETPGEEEDNLTTASGTGQETGQKNPELCERAKMNLIALEGVKNISVRNDKGELRVLSPEEKQTQKEIAEAQARIYCD